MKQKMKNEDGMTLIESMIAMIIMLGALLTMAQVLTYCAVASKAYGRDTGETTAAARDKLEELMGLDFGDSTTDVTKNAPFPAGGKGLSDGGSINPAAPDPNYSDKLDFSGVRTSSVNPLEIAFVRQWEIAADGNVKKITVLVTSNRSFRYGNKPSTTLVTYKAP